MGGPLGCLKGSFTGSFKGCSFFWFGDVGWCGYRYKSGITSRTVNYGNNGIFLMMGNAGFMASARGHWGSWLFEGYVLGCLGFRVFGGSGNC